MLTQIGYLLLKLVIDVTVEGRPLVEEVLGQPLQPTKHVGLVTIISALTFPLEFPCFELVVESQCQLAPPTDCGSRVTSLA